MQTTIDIDDTLLAEAMAATGQTTGKAAVEEALRRIIQLHRQVEAGDRLWGIGWGDEDLGAMREGRDR